MAIGAAYAKGKWALGECARSGRKMLLRNMIADGYYPNLIVDPEWYEPKHPQESLPSVRDPTALYRPAPERDRIGNVIELGGAPGLDPIPSGGFGTPLGGIGGGFGGASLAFGYELSNITPVIDPVLFSNVELLAGFNGSDAATTFTEESTNVAVATFSGNAQLDTAFQRFGTASLLLDGVGDFVTFPDIAPYSLLANDFTIEGFMRFASLPNDSTESGMALASHYLNTGNQRAWFFGANDTSELEFSWTIDGIASQRAFGPWTPTLVINRQYHVAVSRIGNDLRMFIDGIQVILDVGSDNIAGDSIFNSSDALRIGAVNSIATFRWFMDGHIDEVRIIVGQGIYKTDFNPPIAEFPRS